MATKKEEAAIKRIAKTKDPRFGGRAFAVNGFYYYSDGMRIVGDTGTRPDYEVQDGKFITSIFEYYKNNNTPVCIDLENVKAYIKSDLWKISRRPYVIDIAGIKIGLNPKFIKDHVEFMKSCVVYVDISNEKNIKEDFNGNRYLITGIYNKTDCKVALTLPINLNIHSNILADQTADGEILINHAEKTMQPETLEAVKVETAEAPAAAPENVKEEPEAVKAEDARAEAEAVTPEMHNTPVQRTAQNAQYGMKLYRVIIRQVFRPQAGRACKMSKCAIGAVHETAKCAIRGFYGAPAIRIPLNSLDRYSIPCQGIIHYRSAETSQHRGLSPPLKCAIRQYV